MSEVNKGSYVRWFRDLGIEDVPLVGGKNASLGEMVRELGARGVNVPDGFALTADAYRETLRHSGLESTLRDLFVGLDPSNVTDLQRRGRAARQAVLGGSLPPALAAEVAAAYRELSEGIEGGVDVAVRSSATAEDLPDASFAGQQETYLNVHGEASLLDAVKRCMASLFTDRAISYRFERGYDQLAVALSVGVQRMVRSDLASAGVMFTLDTESGFRDVVLITGAWGLGENVVQGAVVPDEYVVFKPTLGAGFRPILRRTVGSKGLRMIYDEGGGRLTRNVPVAREDQVRRVLTDDEVLELARQAIVIEDHYTQRHGKPTPMDIEWAKDGRTGGLFIVQARPETVMSRKTGTTLERHVLEETGEAVVTGIAVGAKIASGDVRVIRDVSELSTFRDGEILVAERTDPDWEPVMRRASAIVTDHGGRTCHAAIVSRELGVPALVGSGDATKALGGGGTFTVDCASGEVGHVYAGALKHRVDRVDVGSLERPRTRIMMNVGNPGEALRLAAIPNDGVGLAREEFIVSSGIGIHPSALVDYPNVPPVVRAAIDERTAGYTDKTAFYVDRLAEGVGTIAAAFWPNDVIVRLSDFKTNEYAHLVGGEAYEAKEENPMLGFRGASRYRDPRYTAAFALECAALRRVREDMGLFNLKIMVPFCRTAAEGRGVLEEMARHGLVRGQNLLEVYVMCEIPSNAIEVDAFAAIFDGFSIGSNDLTQLTLGVDRDSERVAPLFDERDPAVKWLIERAIVGAHRRARKIGICGQAPSDYPDFAAWLVSKGIDSLSLNPDAVLATTLLVLDLERSMGKPGGQSPLDSMG